jgi:CAF1 family ribonuclease
VVVSPSSSSNLVHIRQAYEELFLAVSFLLKNKFRFDLPFTEGIPYLSRKEEEQIRASWAARDAERAAFKDMVLKVDDKPLVDHIHRSVRQWLAQPLLERDDYLNIPHTTPEAPKIKDVPSALNRYQIRLTHQIIRKDYANLKTLGRDGFVRISVRNEKEDAEEKLRQERYREQDVVHAIEFRWLVEALCGGDISKIPERCFIAAMSNDAKPKDDDNMALKRFIGDLQGKLKMRRRVLFGHNCFTDLVYLYTCFIGDPPDKVEDFQELVHELFPAIVDTKYLASLEKVLRFNSTLEALEKEMRGEKLPMTDVPTGFDKYIWGEKFHEAGFDSFMTAKIAIKLSSKLERERKHAVPKKAQIIVKAGETILMDAAIDTEDDEQTEEYVTASESAPDSESIMGALASKLSRIFSPREGSAVSETQSDQEKESSKTVRKLPNNARSVDNGVQKDSVSKIEAQSHPPPNSQQLKSQMSDATLAAPIEVAPADSSVVAVKGKNLGWRSPVEVKQIKSALAHNNLFDVLDNPTEKVADGDASVGDSVASDSIQVDAQARNASPDLLIWSDKEDEEDEAEGLIDWTPKPPKPLSAEELEAKVNAMAAKGEMMPRWDSESGIWKVIGNRLVVNASEEGVCIL